ncbi:hypothetical protein I317_01377 [Kwoniella heveanensis CBS 569]|nr:hypothetical protein I317_01377 [Kwoniella heveanensis CBS 569]
MRQWQTFTTKAPITPELEEAFRRQAAAAFAMSPQSMGYSITSSISSRNGVTTSQTSLQIGKATPWTPVEVDMVERYLVGLFPAGQLLGPSGRPEGLIDHSHPSTHSTRSTSHSHHSSSHSHHTGQTFTYSHGGAPSIMSIPSTISEAGTVPPSKPSRGLTMKRSDRLEALPASPTSAQDHVDVQRHEAQHHQGRNGHEHGHGNGTGVFKSISQKFSKKTALG